jgi:hypothetical protein
MSNEVQSAGTLLAALKELYQSLPEHIQVRVARLLRECAQQKESEVEVVN